MEEPEDEGYEDVDERELPLRPWPRASPLLKSTGETRKDSSSSTCCKSLFVCSSNSRFKNLAQEIKRLRWNKSKWVLQ